MFSINIGSAFIDFFDIGVGAILADGGHHLLDGHLPVWLVTILADGIGGGIQTVATFYSCYRGALYLFLAVLESSGYMARAAFVLDKVMQKIGLPGKVFVPLVLVLAVTYRQSWQLVRLTKSVSVLVASMAPFMSCGARLPVYALFAAAFFLVRAKT